MTSPECLSCATACKWKSFAWKRTRRLKLSRSFRRNFKAYFINTLRSILLLLFGFSCMTRDSLYELHFSNYLNSPLLFFRQTLGIPSPYVFEVLRAVPMKSAVCWNVVTYRLVRIYWRFESTLIFHILSTRVNTPILWMLRQHVPLHGRKIFLPDYVASFSKRCTAPMFRVEECLFIYRKNEGMSYFVTLVDFSRL